MRGHRSYEECGASALMEELMRLAQNEYQYFSEFTNNPKIEDVERGVRCVKIFQPDVIIAIGGGSVIDMAKLIRYNANLNTRLVAIPTTSGTGAESTQFAVCYIEGEKQSISNPKILPEEAILVPEWTMHNNYYLTACTGFDAFAQAVEALWSIHATEESDLYAQEALALLYRCLAQFATDPQLCMADKHWREEMMIGANLSGQAINIARTTAPHAMSYKLTSEYGYPHGFFIKILIRRFNTQ